MLTEYFEDKILQPAERDFNLMVLYGKDVEWADVVNSCRRFPMERSGSFIALIAARMAFSPSALSLPARASAFNSRARSFIAAFSSAVNPAPEILAGFLVSVFGLIIISLSDFGCFDTLHKNHFIFIIKILQNKGNVKGIFL